MKVLLRKKFLCVCLYVYNVGMLVSVFSKLLPHCDNSLYKVVTKVATTFNFDWTYLVYIIIYVFCIL